MPIVSHAAALFEPYIRPSAVHSMLRLPAGVLQSLHTRVSNPRRAWQRFVAVRIPSADALAMDPLVLPEASCSSIDTTIRWRPIGPTGRMSTPCGTARTSPCAMWTFFLNRLVLRPHNIAFPVELIEIEPGEAPGDLLAGRIALI